MNSLFAAHIELPDTAVPPDPWDRSGEIRLSLDHVISRHKDGSMASRLGDYSWIWSAYHPRGKHFMLHFLYWKKHGVRIDGVAETSITPDRVRRIREIQHLMSLVVYRHDGRPLGCLSLRTYAVALGRLAKFAERQSLEILEVLECPKKLSAMMSSMNDRECADFVRCLSFLYSLDPKKDVGYEIAKPLRYAEFLKRASDYRGRSKQTPPLPTRIYSMMITALSAELEEMESIADRFELFLKSAVHEYIRCKTIAPDKEVLIGPELIPQVGMLDYMAHRGYAINLTGLMSVLKDIQIACKLMIHTFSGMRTEECLHLPYHCLEVEQGRQGQKHYLIQGITTKLDGSRRRRTRWVTNQEGARAIRIAQRFSGIIYEVRGVVPRKELSTMDDTPLFVSLAQPPWETGGNYSSSVFLPPKSLAFSMASDYLRERLRPCIENDDLDELEDIDPHRAWRSELEFQVGQPWTLAPHQLRRSLALYAQRSGLVTLSSLRRQLQHITKEMSLYYSAGSLFARNFIEDDQGDFNKHICNEWRTTMAESAGLAYLRDVLFSDEALYGGAGNFIEQAKKRGSVMSRDETMKRFKQGLLVYKANPLGGCTNPGVCDSDKKGLSFLDVPCLAQQCKHLIAKESNLMRVIPYQQQLVETLDPSSVSYSMEKRELDALIAAHDAIQGRSKEKCNV
jgi:hypothetical protein